MGQSTTLFERVQRHEWLRSEPLAICRRYRLKWFKDSMPWKAWKRNRLESRSGREKSKGSSGNWAVSCCHLDPFGAWCSLWVIRNGIQQCKPARVPVGRLWHSKCAHSKDARVSVSPLFLQADCRRESWKGPSIYGSLMAVDRGAWQHGWHAGYLCSICDVSML